jgi:hypothetical protein
MAKVIVGSTSSTRATYRNRDGGLENPDTIVAWVKKPDQTITAGGITITNVSTGVYDVDVDHDDAGIWYLEVTATGTIVNKVLETTICVVWSSVA